MEDKSIVDMDARRGNFNNKTQLLHLQEKIFLKSSTGYEARLTDALVDMDKSSVHSDQPVKVKLLNGNLDAQESRYRRQRRAGDVRRRRVDGSQPRQQCSDDAGDRGALRSSARAKSPAKR